MSIRTRFSAVALAAFAAASLSACTTLGLTSPGPYAALATDSAEEIWEKGRAAFAEGLYAEAGDAFAAIVTRHEDHPLAADALFYEAECRYGLGKHQGAFALYKQFLRDNPMSRHAPLVQRRLFDMGTYTLRAGKDVWLGILTYSDQGVEMLEYLVSVFPRGDLADDALKAIADFEIAERRTEDAIEHLKELLQYYPSSEWALVARLDLARSYRDLNRGTAYDVDVLQRALAEYRAYLELVGSDPTRKAEYSEEIAAAGQERDEVLELLAEKSLAKAEYYLRTNQPDAARSQLLTTVERYPETRAADDARRQLGVDGVDGIDGRGGSR